MILNGNLFLARNDVHVAVVPSNNNLSPSTQLTPHYNPALCMVTPPASDTVNMPRSPTTAAGSS